MGAGVDTIFKGQRMVVLHAFDDSVDVDLSKEIILDISTLTMCNGDIVSSVSVEEVKFNVKDGTITLEWDRSTDMTIGTFTGFNKRLWTVPLKDPGTGGTGDILMTTDCIGGSYDVELTLIMHK